MVVLWSVCGEKDVYLYSTNVHIDNKQKLPQGLYVFLYFLCFLDFYFFLVTFVCCFDCCLIACVEKLINRLATTGVATQSKKKWNSTKEVCNVPETVLHASSNCVVWCVASFGPRKGRAQANKNKRYYTMLCAPLCFSVRK